MHAAWNEKIRLSSTRCVRGPSVKVASRRRGCRNKARPHRPSPSVRSSNWIRAAARRASSFLSRVDCSSQSRALHSCILTGLDTVYAVGGVQQEKLCKPCEQCQDETRSRCKAGYHQTASAYACSERGSSGRPPREARTEHEHHCVDLHRCCSP